MIVHRDDRCSRQHALVLVLLDLHLGHALAQSFTESHALARGGDDWSGRGRGRCNCGCSGGVFKILHVEADLFIIVLLTLLRRRRDVRHAGAGGVQLVDR